MVDPAICVQSPTSQPRSLLIHTLPVSMPNDPIPLTPLTPVELISGQLNDLHNVVPPLSYFENIANERMQGPSSPAISNGWDFSVNSPFQIVNLSPSNTIVPAIVTSSVTPILQHQPPSITSPPAFPSPQSSPRNFFSKLKPRPSPLTSPPLPVYIHEIPMTGPSQSTELIEPIYAQIKKDERTSHEQIVNINFCLKFGGILFSLFLDIK